MITTTTKHASPKPPQRVKPNPHAIQQGALHAWMVSKARVEIRTQFGDAIQGAIAGYDVYCIRLSDGTLLFKSCIASIREVAP